MKLSDVRQWSFEHLEEEAKIEESMLATSDEQVKNKSYLSSKTISAFFLFFLESWSQNSCGFFSCRSDENKKLYLSKILLS